MKSFHFQCLSKYILITNNEHLSIQYPQLEFRNCTFSSNVPLEANLSNGPHSQEECGMRVALVLGKVGFEVS